MIGYLINYFTFKEFCLLTLIVYLIMCWYNIPTYARAVNYMQSYQEQLDLKNNVKYDVSQHIYLYRDWETDRKSTRLNSSHRL